MINKVLEIFLRYLIYYNGIIHLQAQRESEMTIYMYAKIPVLLYTIRLVEMIYFSLNFIFYYSLSASLRREIRTYLRGLLDGLFSAKKALVSGGAGGGQSKREARGGSATKKTLNGMDSPKRATRRSKQRLFSSHESSDNGADCIDCLDRLRSISPMHRPTLFFTETFSFKSREKASNAAAEEEEAAAANKSQRRRQRRSSEAARATATATTRPKRKRLFWKKRDATDEADKMLETANSSLEAKSDKNGAPF